VVFLVQPQNQGRWVSRFGPQNRQLRFGDLVHKITAMVSWFGTQNQVGYGLSVVPQNRWEDGDSVGHVSRSSSLLRLDTSRARVSQSSLNTGGDAAQMVHVTSSRKLHGSEAKDDRSDGVGCSAVEVGQKYHSLVVISFLACRGILVF
jgi:hypothetical protein